MKRRILPLTGLLLAALVIILFATRHPSDSYRYQNKTVRQWLQQRFGTNRQAVMDAFHNMGTNAIPGILRELKRSDPWWNRLYLRAYLALPAPLKHLCPVPVPQHTISLHASFILNDYLRRPGSRIVFSNLVPVLGYNKCDWTARYNVFQTMAGVAGPRYQDSVPALTALSRDPDLDTRAMAAILLWKIDGQAFTASAALHAAMDSPQPSNMKDQTPSYIVQVNPMDKSIIPVLIRNLHSTNIEMQVEAAGVLMCCWPAATSAIPALTNLLSSSNSYVHDSALEALESIAPEIAAKYQPQPETEK